MKYFGRLMFRQMTHLDNKTWCIYSKTTTSKNLVRRLQNIMIKCEQASSFSWVSLTNLHWNITMDDDGVALDLIFLWFCSLCQSLEGDFCKAKDFCDWKSHSHTCKQWKNVVGFSPFFAVCYWSALNTQHERSWYVNLCIAWILLVRKPWRCTRLLIRWYNVEHPHICAYTIQLDGDRTGKREVTLENAAQWRMLWQSCGRET